jgi:hypothetical protein
MQIRSGPLCVDEGAQQFPLPFKREIIIFSASLEFRRGDNTIKTRIGVVKGVASYCPIRRRGRDMHSRAEGPPYNNSWAVETGDVAPLLIKSDTSQQLAVETRHGPPPTQLDKKKS